MSAEEKVEVVRGLFEAYAKGDNEAALAAFDPAVAFHWTFRPDGGVFHGREGVAEAMRSWTGTFEEHRIELTEVRDAGDCLFVELEEIGRGKGSGVETSQATWHVVTLRSDSIIHWQGFASREEALEAAGLSE